jgi:hypothetical protein
MALTSKPAASSNLVKNLFTYFRLSATAVLQGWVADLAGLVD